MTGNISYLSEYEPYNGGYVSFGYGGGKITSKGTIKTGKPEFENVYFMKELKYNLFSVSQICDNKHSVLFTDSECLVLGKDFKLADDSHVLLRIPRHQNMRKDVLPSKKASQVYGAVLPECLTSPKMKESKAYKTYLGYATGEVPPKVARKFKKASPSKKESELVSGDEEPVKKGKRLKTPSKKSASMPATGIELQSEVALFEKAQIKEARKKSLRDFHKTHPSGSDTVAEKPPSVEKITPTGNDEDDNNNEKESSDESSKQENESEEQELTSEQDEESDDDDQEEKEFDQENESEDDEIKSDDEKGMDDTTDQFDDDADATLEEPTETAI
ncbi:hypothetical protein Tco_1010238 [Tanacetum coccineum]